jgi:hypothetical protein
MVSATADALKKFLQKFVPALHEGSRSCRSACRKEAEDPAGTLGSAAPFKVLRVGAIA